jgi:hypothetical protein
VSLLTPGNIHRPAPSQPDEIPPAGILLARVWPKRTHCPVCSERIGDGLVVQGKSAEVIENK